MPQPNNGNNPRAIAAESSNENEAAEWEKWELFDIKMACMFYAFNNSFFYL